MAHILITGVKVPFTTGGQEVLVNTLMSELQKRGHTVDKVELPMAYLPKERILNSCALWNALDLTEFAGQKVDLVIATKFPSYFVHHPKKSVWLVHQHRAVYDLYGGRYSDISDDLRDEQFRRILCDADKTALQNASYISGISANVIERLEKFCGIRGEVLYPPLPQGSSYHCLDAEPYILSVGRLCTIKRTDLLIKSLPFVDASFKAKIVGRPDEPGVMDYYKNEIAKHHLEDRIEFLGRVSDEELLDLYAKSTLVYYAPKDEDYGYVTLEGMASSKPIITARDSGGVLEFVEDGKNGLVLDPTEEDIGRGIEQLLASPDKIREMGKAGRALIEEAGLLEKGWDSVVDGLLSPLSQSKRVLHA